MLLVGVVYLNYATGPQLYEKDLPPIASTVDSALVKELVRQHIVSFRYNIYTGASLVQALFIQHPLQVPCQENMLTTPI